MGPEETEKSIEEIVGMIKQGDLSLAPKLYEQTKGIHLLCCLARVAARAHQTRSQSAWHGSRGSPARGLLHDDPIRAAIRQQHRREFQGIPVRPYPGAGSKP